MRHSTDKDLQRLVGYEATDVKLIPIGIAFAGLIVLFGGSSIAMMLFYNFTAPKYGSDSNVPTWSTERKFPRHPQLQSSPKEEMNLYKEAEAPYVKRTNDSLTDIAQRGISGVPAGNEPKVFSNQYPGSRSDTAPQTGGHETPQGNAADHSSEPSHEGHGH